MKILFLTQVVPYPLDSGPKIKTNFVLRYLSARHEVHLVSFVRSRDEVRAARALAPHCASITTVPIYRSRSRDVYALYRSIRGGRPLLVERDDVSSMRVAIDRLLRQHAFDAVHADQLTMGQFAVDLPLPLRVLDQHNAVWSIVRRITTTERWGPRRLIAEREWRILRGYEGDLFRRFDAVTVVSAEDRYLLEAAAGGTFRSVLIPIAIDADGFPFRTRATCDPRIISVATMYYPPNAEGVDWFAREVFPLICQKIPSATLTVVGSRPPTSIRRLDTPSSGITVTGYVDDVTPLLDASAVMVVPLHAGSGMRVKILEAFARGVPVVSTTIGVEGIDARPGEHLLVADHPVEFASAVATILRDRELAGRLASSARALVEARYDWKAALAPLDDLYPPVRSGR